MYMSRLDNRKKTPLNFKVISQRVRFSDILPLRHRILLLLQKGLPRLITTGKRCRHCYKYRSMPRRLPRTTLTWREFDLKTSWSGPTHKSADPLKADRNVRSSVRAPVTVNWTFSSGLEQMHCRIDSQLRRVINNDAWVPTAWRHSWRNRAPRARVCGSW